MTRHLITLCVALSLGRVATAQPEPPADQPPPAASSADAEAEALFRQAVALMDAGQIAEACTAFDGSQQRAPALTTLFNQAACREKNGQLATAWGLYVEAERQTRGSSDATAQTLHQVAQDHAAKLEPRLSKLTVNVAKDRPPGLEITRVTVALDVTAWGRALPTDGGRITITARAPGYISWSTTIDLKQEADAKTVEVPVLKIAIAAAEVPRPKTVPLVLAGAAVVLLGTGLAFDLSAESTYNQYKLIGGSSPLYDSANHKRWAAEGLAWGGVACAAAGAWIYFFSHPHKESLAGRKVTVAPMVGGDGAGLQVVGRY